MINNELKGLNCLLLLVRKCGSRFTSAESEEQETRT